MAAEAAAMVDEAGPSHFPSTDIGSPLSRNWDPAELLKPSGFICGDCASPNAIRARDSIRCRECGYRILYKIRKRRPMEFLAR
mmetsp:Transcript_2191/g.2530  ORF Transcript_2191/g.2530 Transcript_2191/m.2530 type:complete len:83 (-) Transcript_2191:44-292(-)